VEKSWLSGVEQIAKTGRNESQGGFVKQALHWLVVSNIFYFHSYLGKMGKISNLTSITTNQPVQFFVFLILDIFFFLK